MHVNKTSNIRHFYKKNHNERLDILQKFASLTKREIFSLKNFISLDFDSTNRMIENVISIFPMPLGIANYFLINGKDYLVPMALEEPSVVAAASSAAKLARHSGGFYASCTDPIMIGQIQLIKIKNLDYATNSILKNKLKILELANKQDPTLIKIGGGATDLQVKTISTSRGNMLVVHLLVNVQDAMGANIVNTMAEKISHLIEQLADAKSSLKIVSNLPIYRTTKAKAIWGKKIIGENVIEKILDACAFAQADPFRCTTHNKGIMNGIDAVAIATGNDFRALEAGVHAYACFKQNYSPLTKYYKNTKGDLVGEIEIPMTAGTVGGITQTHPIAKICLKILRIKTASELSQVLASVGLAQNFAALKALVTTGIQSGHMKLHSKNIAITAGATKEDIDLIAKQMNKENNISINRAKELIKEYEK